jgi:hypothetical protein
LTHFKIKILKMDGTEAAKLVPNTLVVSWRLAWVLAVD